MEVPLWVFIQAVVLVHPNIYQISERPRPSVRLKQNIVKAKALNVLLHSLIILSQAVIFLCNTVILMISALTTGHLVSVGRNLLYTLGSE